MHLTLEEKETIILFNEADSQAKVYTCNKSMMRQLDELCKNSVEITEVLKDEHSKTYLLPKKWIKVRKPRQLSVEKRTELALRAKRNFGHKESEVIT